jgi:hypothetical protein
VSLKELAVGRLDSDGVHDRKLIEQLAGGRADGRRNARLVFRRERGDEPDIHIAGPPLQWMFRRAGRACLNVQGS